MQLELKSGNHQTPNATDEEKVAAKAKVDEAVNNAKASDQATNNNGVDTAKSEGTDAINHVQPVVVKKDEAKVATIKPRKLKRKSIKHLMRQMKRRQQQKLKLMKQ